MKYIKKSLEVEAKQFTNEEKNVVYTWALSIQGNVYHDWDQEGRPVLKIPTKEGEMECSIGDFLIKEPFASDDRRIYPCKPDIFEKTYDPVEN